MCPRFRPVGFDLTGNYDVNGPVGGAQGGCNYQTGAWVWGVEVDGGWSSASGQAVRAPTRSRSGFNPQLPVHHQRALACHRPRPPRLGRRPVDVVRDRRRRLVRFRPQQLQRHRRCGAQRQPSRVNKTGWVVGLGTEYALLGGWSVKSEWLYANFGTMSYGTEPGIVNGCTAGCVSADVKMYEYIWRVGLNYRFDWATFGKGKGPVVAKY